MGNKELALAIENTEIQKALKTTLFLLLNNSSKTKHPQMTHCTEPKAKFF